MARDGRGFIQEVSDSDSIRTKSTTESEHDPDEDFGVEHILDEDPDFLGTGELRYLLKWQGYDVTRATWEPVENLQDGSLLGPWEARKEKFRKGLLQPFDRDAWEENQELLELSKLDRHRRRKAKRRRRGVPVSGSGEEDYEPDKEEPPKRHRSIAKRDAELFSGDEDVIGSGKKQRHRKTRPSFEAGHDSGDDDVDQPSKPPRRKATTSTEPRRRGRAQVVKKPRSAVKSLSNDDADIENEPVEGDNDSDLDSLFEQGSQPIYPSPGQSAQPTQKVLPTAVPHAKPSAKASNPTTTSTKRTTTVTGAGRKTAPQPSVTTSTASTAKRTKSNIFANFNDTDKKRRQRARVSGETPKDSTENKFRNLRTQNIMQKYSRNEPAPNINNLTIVDPKTGKATLPKVTTTATSTSARGASGGIHSAYHRRTPPPADRSKADTQPQVSNAPDPAVSLQTQTTFGRPLAPPGHRRTRICNFWLDGICKQTPETCMFAHGNEYLHWNVPQAPVWQQGSISGPSQRPSMAETTCYYWQKGGCKFSDEECNFAHRDTGVYSNRESQMKQGTKKQLTCYYWKHGDPGCQKPADECEYAHFDTGIVAPKPAQRKGSTDVVNAIMDMQAHLLARTRENAALHTEALRVINEGMAMRESPPAMPESDSTGPQVVLQLPHQDLRTQQQPQSSDAGMVSVSISVTVGGGEQLATFDAHLHMISHSIFEKLLPTQNGVNITFDRTVTAKDIRTFCAGLLNDSEALPTGSIVTRSTESHAAADRLAEHCRLHVAALACICDSFTLLIYPSNAEEWRFLDTLNAPALPVSSLRIRMLAPVTQHLRTKLSLVTMTSAAVNQAASVVAGHAVLGLDAERFLGENQGDLVPRNVFLAIPPNRQAELKVLIDYFQGLKCKVYHSMTSGAWAYFRQNRSKARQLLIIHTATPIWELPSLHDFLREREAFVRVFSVGTGVSIDHAEAALPTFSCERMFPHGKVIFITDDLFVHHPSKATAVIQDFLKTNSGKPLGAVAHKIATRPGVKDWLLKVANESDMGRGRQDMRYVELYKSICDLCPLEDEDPYDLPNPLPSSYLVSFPADELPSFHGLWEKDEEAATDLMVEWFAGWCVLNANKFHRFFVCYEPKKGKVVIDEHGRSDYQVEADPRGWAKKYQHIGVISPDELLRRTRERR